MKNLLSRSCYALLLAVSVVFVVTVLAYAVVPWDEQPEWLRAHGWQFVLGEVAAIIVLGLLSMGLDRLQQEPVAGPAKTGEERPS